MQEIISEVDAQALTDHDYSAFLHQGCISVPDAAKALWLHREAVRTTIQRHGLGHRHGTTRTAPIYLTLEELAIAYPGNIRQRPPRKGSARYTAWTRADRAKFTSPEHIGPGTPEFEASKERMKDRTTT